MIYLIEQLKRIKSSRRLQLIVAAGIIVAGTSSVAAFNTLTSTEASDTPVEVKVEDHGQRISKNESDIAQTNDRIGQVEQQTQANTSAIGAAQERVTVVERKVVQQAGGQPSQPAQSPQAGQAPAPAVPTINPRRIVAMSVNVSGFGQSQTLWNCTYTLEGGRTINTIQAVSCYGPGAEITDEMAEMHGVGR